MSRAYVGAKAKGYLAKRAGTRKWKRENKLVELMLAGTRGDVLDVPVGTGRFVRLYKKLGLRFTGLDLSEDMVAIALKELGKGGERGTVSTGDAAKLPYPAKYFDAVVCVRLLHLLKEKEMSDVMRQICRVARSRVVLTIQLGPKFSSTPDVQTHNERRFGELVTDLGFLCAEDHKITGAGWHVMRLERA